MFGGCEVLERDGGAEGRKERFLAPFGMTGFWLHGGEAGFGKRYRQAARALEAELDRYWDADRGLLRSQMKIWNTDGYTAKNTEGIVAAATYWHVLTLAFSLIWFVVYLFK